MSPGCRRPGTRSYPFAVPSGVSQGLIRAAQPRHALLLRPVANEPPALGKVRPGQSP